MDLTRASAYEVVSRQELADIHSEGWLLRHKKTGARVMLIENDDENKVFNIAFRTPPKNSTGVAHILEHSVLCGSREFPLKDPFVELVKGSLNTFLNAMTYPDKTCYPVASCNDQDFQNLMHVYLDAVFYPRIYEREEIFRQEGWNYHLEDPEGPLTYNGVVYNEMKGAFSSPDDVLEREIMNRLFPDTAYGVESGGDPKNIPDLSYEEFLQFHRTYYHPSNSFIYLYGNMDMADKLDFIDRKYLSAFDALDVSSMPLRQKAFGRIVEETKEYPLSENEDPADNSYLSYNVVIDHQGDPKADLAFQVLDYALLSAPGAPLKMTLLEEGIGSDVYGSYESGLLQPYFSVIAKGANESQQEAFRSVIRKVLEENAEKGIDRKALKAGINYMEFRYREADFSSLPKGLMYGLDLLETWLYEEEDPFAHVKLLPVFDELKKAIPTGYFENLIRTQLLENTHGCYLTLVPSPGLAARQDQELAEKLKKILESLTAEEKQNLIDRTNALTAYQEAEDSPEDIARLPMLSREDIRKNIRGFSNRELDVDGSLLLYHPVDTFGIGYVDAMLDIRDMTVEDVHYLGLLKAVLGYIDTEHYTYGELYNEINAGTGGLACGVEVYEQPGGEDRFRAKLAMNGKALYNDLGLLFDMIMEILHCSKLEDTHRIGQIVAEGKSRIQASMVSAGHSTAVTRAASYGSLMARFQDEMTGIGFYRFLEELDRDFEARAAEAAGKLKALCSRLLTRENLMISYTGEEKSLPVIREQMKRLLESLPSSGKKPQANKNPWLGEDLLSVRNEGFRTAGQVQYVAQCGSFTGAGLSYTGALDILKVILSYDYLWMNLRVKGGAYGCMSGFRRSGESYFVSYRDPHLHRTLDVFKGIPEYIRSFDADEKEMTRYIIGTVSSKDVPRTPKMQGSVSRTAWMCGVTEETAQKERDQILQATAQDIRDLAPLVEAVLSAGQICVVGSETALDGAEDVLKNIEPLFQ